MPVFDENPASIAIKPASQFYLSCDTQGNCCDLETNICQNINIDPGMSAMPSSGLPIGIQVTQGINKLGQWIKSNPLVTLGIVLGVAVIGGGRRR